MKKHSYIGYLGAIILVGCIMSFTFRVLPDNSAVNGAWKLQKGTVEQVLILNDGYFMHTTFDKTKKTLISTRGGVYQYGPGSLQATIEFSPQAKAEIGQTMKYTFAVNKDRLTSDINGKKESWTQLDNGKGVMVGTWRSSGRMQDGKVVLSPPRARKTFKLVSGSRYQWAAINAETKEFFGTGGGSYTYADGKYTETLDFFTKDSTKVGSSLSFNGKIEGDLWHHSGKSSQGADMYEIWKMESKH